MPKEAYTVRCRRCGRYFVARYPNSLYCDLPSLDPDDEGRTCKQMRRIESKRKTRENQKHIQSLLVSGDMVATSKYGYIERSDYIAHFEQMLKEKYNLATYAEFQQWRRNHPDLLSDEYEAFQRETGLRSVAI